jgi:hypothetical protein
MAVARYRDAFNCSILIETLERAARAGVLSDYTVKGAAAIELRFGATARATRDLDLELPVPLDALRSVFSTALELGCDDFTFELRDRVLEIREEALRVTVVMRYLGLPWAQIDVDLAPSTPGDFAESIAICNDEMPAIAGVARTMRTEFLIAQKIHAALTPDEPDYAYAYSRHVVDVLFLAGMDVDRENIRAACHAVFELRAQRDGRSWPPTTLTLPERWVAEYAATLNQYPNLNVRPEDVPAAFTRLLVDIIGGIKPVPGYEYRFHVVQYFDRTSPQSALVPPVKTSGVGYEGFANLASDGWRVRTAVEIRRGNGDPELLIILEREFAAQAS